MNIFQKFITSKLLKFVFIAVLAIQLIGLPAIPLASDFDLDPSVVLYLPFYKYGTEIGSKIFDESQYGNHGTIVGAVPAQIPMLLGVELVANGAFETDPNVEWSPVDGTIALVAGGQSGNCLEITRVAEAVQSARQTMTRFVIGKRYKISGWVKSGTSGNEEFQIGDTWHGLIWITGTSSATWTYYETIFIATFGAEFMFALVKNSATPGTMLFDQVSIQEVEGIFLTDVYNFLLQISKDESIVVTDSLFKLVSKTTIEALNISDMISSYVYMPNVPLSKYGTRILIGMLLDSGTLHISSDDIYITES